jgi:predicted O-methyltransferase YrrM
MSKRKSRNPQTFEEATTPIHFEEPTGDTPPVITTVESSLAECLADMVERFDLPLDLLAYKSSYAVLRPDGKNYPQATGTPGERHVLYALVRALKPRHAVEIGVLWGVSTIQLLSAMWDNNYGDLTSVDILREIEGKRKPGHLIPNDFRKRLTLHIGMDGKDYFSADKEPIQFLFEDASHEYDSTRAIHEASRVQLAPGALVVSHDPLSRPEIQRAFVDIGISPVVYRIDDSPYGLALWRN